MAHFVGQSRAQPSLVVNHLHRQMQPQQQQASEVERVWLKVKGSVVTCT
jgi:hypothetical protein